MPARRQIILFPILFAIYPALNLYATNAGSIEPAKGLLPVLLIAASMAALYLGVSRLIKASTSAALVATALGVFLFYYGYLFNGLRDFNLFAPPSYRLVHTVFLTLWSFLLLVVCLNAYRRRLVKPTLNSYLNYLSFAMVGLPIVALVPHLMAGSVSVAGGEARQGTPIGAAIDLETLPDVYYIILDGYGRDDVLASHFDFDNGDFLRGLEERGFYVARESCANYSMTYTSLSSSLNLDYLDVLVPGATSTAALTPLFHENTVLRTFDNLGYTTIHFATLWAQTSESPLADIVYKYHQVDPYDRILVDTTLLAPFLVITAKHDTEALNRRTLENQRSVTTETLRQLERIPAMAEPTFTFAHLIAPHPPYLFDREGNLPEYGIVTAEPGDLTQWRPLEGYVDQAMYINRQITAVIDAILRQSQPQPIIIIQGDHGPQTSQQLEPQTRLPVLNAYHLPDGGEQYLYPAITPVNSFRLALDLYFGRQWGLLDDTYHFSDYANPMAMVDAECPPRER